MKYRKLFVRTAAGLLCLSLFSAACSGRFPVQAEEEQSALYAYNAYQKRLDGVKREADIAASGFDIIENQVFTMTVKAFGDVSMIPAIDRTYRRLVLFFADENGDGKTDILLITSCEKEDSAAGRAYKVGDVLFQNETGFYRDWRLSDKINRFGMNKSIRFIASFLEDGYSTEFLYTAATLDELKEHGFKVVSEQSYWRKFEKLGNLLVVPGTYRMAEYTVFMVYLVNEQGYIVWSFQPMGDYENLYALKGVACRDIDGDGMKDLAVLARYSYEGKDGETILENDYSIYYQKTGGFYPETEFKKQYQSKDDSTMEELVEKARAYWGWRQES